MDWRTAYEDPPAHLRSRWKAEDDALRRYEEPGAFGLNLGCVEPLADPSCPDMDPHEAWVER